MDYNDDSTIEFQGNQLDKKNSNYIFDRNNKIIKINVFIYTKSLINYDRVGEK